MRLRSMLERWASNDGTASVDESWNVASSLSWMGTAAREVFRNGLEALRRVVRSPAGEDVDRRGLG